MTISSEAQAIALGGAVVLGLALGLFYDFLRPFRLARPTRLREIVLDILFWLTVTLAALGYAPLLENGVVRLYLLLGHVLGLFLYFKLLSPPVRALTGLIMRLWIRLLALLTRPFRRFSALLGKPVKKIRKKLEFSLKKLFSFPVRWVRMLRIPKEFAESVVGPSGDGEDARHDKAQACHQKGWSRDEDCDFHPAGLHHHRPAESSPAGRRRSG